MVDNTNPINSTAGGTLGRDAVVNEVTAKAA